MNDKDIRNQLAGLFSDTVPELEIGKGECARWTGSRASSWPV
jgi:hypothetical protein